MVDAIEDTLAFARTYQDLGMKAPCWQEVEQVFLFGISHVPLLLRGVVRTTGTDEGLIAALVGIPELALWALGFLVTGLTWVAVIRSITPAYRWSRLVSMIAGIAIGMAIYVLWLGPALLP